jgi:hypothetical protein
VCFSYCGSYISFYSLKIMTSGLDMVAQACNSGYLGGGDEWTEVEGQPRLKDHETISQQNGWT